MPAEDTPAEMNGESDLTARVRYGRLVFPYARQLDGVWYFLNPFTDECQPFADQSRVEVLELRPDATPLFDEYVPRLAEDL